MANQDSDDEDLKDEIEKDKIALLPSYFEFQNFTFLPQNVLSIDFIPSLLTAQFAIASPPPEGLA